MKLVLYTSILPCMWKEEYRIKGIKGVKGISDLYAQVPGKKGRLRNVKDAILTQTWPFHINLPESRKKWSREIMVQFSKELKDIYVDYGDSPSAYDDGEMPDDHKEMDLTYARLNVPKFLRQGGPLYCSWVKEIRPEEMLGVYYLKHNEMEHFVDGEPSDKWEERQPVVIIQ